MKSPAREPLTLLLNRAMLSYFWLLQNFVQASFVGLKQSKTIDIKMDRKRYCVLKSCENFYGTSDQNIHMFK